MNLSLKPSSPVGDVVFWIDLTTLDAATVIERYAATPKALGIRPVLEWGFVSSWADEPVALSNLSACQDQGLAVDLFSSPEHFSLTLDI